jgi:gag-polyprotein putative aspartyl protease
MGIYRLSDWTVSGTQAFSLRDRRAPRLLLRCLRMVLNTAGGTPTQRTAKMALLLAILPISIFGAGKNRSVMYVPGYKAVRVHYGPLNKTIMSVRINGHPANLLEDTGASQVILDQDVAESAGVKPFQRPLNQVRFSVPSQVFTMGGEINGQLLPVGLAQNITGAFVTTLHETFVKSLGIISEPTRISARFVGGQSKRLSAVKLSDLNTGAFKTPPETFGVARLPNFALQQGSSGIAGILGMDPLYIHHAIIDLDGLSLFLK